MKSYWTTHQGKKIFCAHYDHLTLDQLRVEINDAVSAMRTQPESSMLTFVDVRGTLIGPEAFSCFKDLAMNSKKYAKRTAIVGVTGAKKVMLEMVIKLSGLTILPFEEERQALDWLAQA